MSPYLVEMNFFVEGDDTNKTSRLGIGDMVTTVTTIKKVVRN